VHCDTVKRASHSTGVREYAVLRALDIDVPQDGHAGTVKRISSAANHDAKGRLIGSLEADREAADLEHPGLRRRAASSGLARNVNNRTSRKTRARDERAAAEHRRSQ